MYAAAMGVIADKAADNRHDEAETFRNSADLLLLKTDIEIKNVGDYAHDHVRGAIRRDQGKDQ